jgi:hypothetical protein
LFLWPITHDCNQPCEVTIYIYYSNDDSTKFHRLKLHFADMWPRDLRRRSAAARLLGLRVWIQSGAWMFLVSVVCCQVEFSATGWSLFRSSPTECGASECDSEVSIMRWSWFQWRLSGNYRKKICILVIRSPQKWNKPTTGIILGAHPASSSVGSGCCLSGGKRGEASSDHWRRLSSLNIEVRAQIHCAAKNLFQMSDHVHMVGCAGVISWLAPALSIFPVTGFRSRILR